MWFAFGYDENGKITIIKSSLHDAPIGIELNKDEVAAVEYIISLLKSYQADVSKLSLEHTQEYLKLCYGMFRGVFCHLKLRGRSFYMELTISSKQAKQLNGDPRFSSISLAQKRFTRIPIVSISDIPLFADVIVSAFQWGTINCDAI